MTIEEMQQRVKNESAVCKPGTVERMQQEHAIYKKFYEAFRDRPINRSGSGIQMHPFDRMKIEAFNLIERLEDLNKGFPYYHPSWTDADAVLFSIITGSDKNDGLKSGHIGEDIIH